MTRVVLSVPKRVGRRTVWVKAVLSDAWSASPVCKDLDTTARLVSLRPEWPLGYLPPPVTEWARAAERVLSARIDSIEGPRGNAPWCSVQWSLTFYDDSEITERQPAGPMRSEGEVINRRWSR